MPHHFEFDHAQRVLLVVVEGEINDAEIMAIDEEMREQIARMQPAAGISDLSGVSAFSVSAQVMRSVALQDAPYPQETPRFIVAPTDVLYGMSRMYELVADRPRGMLQVVRNREEAFAQLGASNLKFEVLH